MISVLSSSLRSLNFSEYIMSVRFDFTRSSSKTFQRIIVNLRKSSRHTHNAKQIKNILKICDNAQSDKELVHRLKLNINFDATALPPQKLQSMLRKCFIPFCIIVSGTTGIITRQTHTLTDSIIASGIVFCISLISYLLVANKINPYYEAINYLSSHIIIRRVLLKNNFQRNERLLDTGLTVNFFNRSIIEEPPTQLATGFIDSNRASLFTFQCATGAKGKESHYEWLGVILHLDIAPLCYEFRNDYIDNNEIWQQLNKELISYKRWSVDVNENGYVVIAVNSIINEKKAHNSNAKMNPFVTLDYKIDNFNPESVLFFNQCLSVIKILKCHYPKR